MKYKFFIVISLFLLIACGHQDNSETEKKLMAELNNLEKEKITLKGQLDKAINRNQEYLLKIEKLEDELELVKLKESPLGVYLETNFASESEYFKFGKDSLVWHSWGNLDNCLIGKWYLDGDWVMIKFYKQIGKRGIGVPLPPPTAVPGNYVDQFEEYENYIEEVTDSSYTKFDAYLDWKEVYEHIVSKNEMELYVIKDFSYDLDISDLDKKVNGKYPQASYRLLNKSDIEKISTRELRIMRNEIFARHGYVFKSEELKDYFSNKGWYSEKYENVDKYLSEIEQENIKLIKSIEGEK